MDKTDEEYADDIKRSADRLVSFCKVIAPEFIIERERRILLKRIINFPVDRESQAANESFDIAEEEKKQNFLMANGFYNDLIEELGLDKE